MIIGLLPTRPAFLSRAGSIVTLAAQLFVVGCAPMIGHGPTVHPGFSGGASAAIGNGPTYENGDDPGPFYIGSGMLHAAYGWQPSSPRLPALRAGVQGPVPHGIAADVYLQAPRGWLAPGAAGFGVVTSMQGQRVMPYLQAGVEDSRGLGGHVVFGRYHEPRRQMIGYWTEERATVTWISLQVPAAAWATVHLHGGFAAGHVTRQASNGTTPYIDEDRWVRLAGVSIELHRSRP